MSDTITSDHERVASAPIVIETTWDDLAAGYKEVDALLRASTSCKDRRSGDDARGPVVVVFGSAESLDGEQALVVERLMRTCIASALARSEATVVTGGTRSGVMRIAGRVFKEVAPGTRLLGVVPAGNAASDDPQDPAHAQLDPNHDVVVRVQDGEGWGDELPVLAGLVERLATADSASAANSDLGSSSGGARPVIVFLVGGREVTAREYQVAVEMGWTVIALHGVGGTSDLVARSLNARRYPRLPRVARWLGVAITLIKVLVRPLLPGSSRSPGATTAGNSLTRRLARSNRFLRVLSVGNPECAATCSVQDDARLGRLLEWRLAGRRPLQYVWLRAAHYDAVANHSQPSTRFLIAASLLIGFLTTVAGLAVWAPVSQEAEWLRVVLPYALVGLPILASAVVAWMIRRRHSESWVTSRAASEALKREILRFRTSTGDYATVSSAGGQRERLLWRRVAEIERAVASDGVGVPTNLNYVCPVWPPDNLWDVGVPSDGFTDSPMDANAYFSDRLVDQQKWLQKAIRNQDRRVHVALLIASLVALAAAITAAIGLPVGEPLEGAPSSWWALSTALAAASVGLAAWLAHDQSETQVRHRLRALAELESARTMYELMIKPGSGARSQTLPGMAAHRMQNHQALEHLVDLVEGALEAEHLEWARTLRQSHEMFQAMQTTSRQS